jgi:hypothetical protein
VARVAAFLPPFSPMVVPARMVLGDMTVYGLAIAVLLEILAISAAILLAARIYERAILRIGAPVKLRRLFPTRPQSMRRADPGTRETPTMSKQGAEEPGLGARQSRLPPLADLALRLLTVVLVITGAVIGFGEPVAIALVAVGLLLLGLEHSLKHRPGKPVH